MEETTESPDSFQEAENSPVVEVDPEAERRLARIVESLLFAAGQPLSLKRLGEILAGPSSREILAAVARLATEYGPGQRGVQLHEVAGGYQLRTARENAEWVRVLFREKPARLGRATLETLSVIAYKQPVTRAEIEAIRGVDVDAPLNTLLSRRLVRIAGRKEAVGRPLLYATTSDFLEAFQLKDLADLPSLKELGSVPELETHETTLSPENPPTGLSPEFPAAPDVAGSPDIDGVVVAGDSDAAERPRPADGPAGGGESGELDEPGTEADERPED